MATKSVIEIELIDEQFKAFSAQLKAMQSIIAQMPEQWKAITKQVNEEQKAEAKASNEAEKARKKRIQEEKEFNRIIEDRKKAFMDAAYYTGNIARNLASGALSIAKWTTFAAIGGGFGLGALASSASDYRRRAQGLGTTTGGLRAAEVNLGQYVDVNSLLSNIAVMQHDITQFYKLGRIGGTQTGDPILQLQTVMTRAIQDFNAHGKDLNYAKAVGLTDIFSPEELIRLSTIGAKELDETFRQLAKDREALKVNDETSRSWQSFFVQLRRAGNDIEVSFIRSLEKLTPKLLTLSETITKLITDFVESADVGKWLQNFSEKIKEFSIYLGSDEFKNNVSEFFDALKALGQAIVKTAKFFGLIDKSKEEKDIERKNASDLNVLRGDIRRDVNEPALNFLENLKNRPFIRDSRSISERLNNPGNLKFAGQAGATLGERGFAKFNTPQEGFLALQNQLQLYASGQSKAAGYKKLNTLEDILKIYAPPTENITGAYIQSLEKLTGKSRTEQLDFSDKQLMATLMASISRVESGKNLYSPSQVQVMITNTTDTNVAVKQLTPN